MNAEQAVEMTEAAIQKLHAATHRLCATHDLMIAALNHHGPIVEGQELNDWLLELKNTACEVSEETKALSTEFLEAAGLFVGMTSTGGAA